MDGRPTWTDCDEAGDYVVPNVLSPRDLVSRPDIMDETVPHNNIPTLLTPIQHKPLSRTSKLEKGSTLQIEPKIDKVKSLRKSKTFDF